MPRAPARGARRLSAADQASRRSAAVCRWMLALALRQSLVLATPMSLRRREGSRGAVASRLVPLAPSCPQKERQASNWLLVRGVCVCCWLPLLLPPRLLPCCRLPAKLGAPAVISLTSRLVSRGRTPKCCKWCGLHPALVPSMSLVSRLRSDRCGRESSRAWNSSPSSELELQLHARLHAGQGPFRQDCQAHANPGASPWCQGCPRCPSHLGESVGPRPQALGRPAAHSWGPGDPWAGPAGGVARPLLLLGCRSHHLQTAVRPSLGCSDGAPCLAHQTPWPACAECGHPAAQRCGGRGRPPLSHRC